MKEEFDQKSLDLIKLLQSLKEKILPSQAAYRQMLSSVPTKVVTNFNLPRYTFDMWKYVAVALVLIVAGLVVFKSQSLTTHKTTVGSQAEVPNQPVTESNADAALQQTDQAILQSTDQADQDLNENSSDEGDLENI